MSRSHWEHARRGGAERPDVTHRGRRAGGLNGDRQHERAVAVARAEGASSEAALAPGQQQRGMSETAALERALPEAVASGAIAGGGGVEADRAGPRATGARRWWWSR